MSWVKILMRRPSRNGVRPGWKNSHSNRGEDCPEMDPGDLSRLPSVSSTNSNNLEGPSNGKRSKEKTSSGLKSFTPARRYNLKHAASGIVFDPTSPEHQLWSNAGWISRSTSLHNLWNRVFSITCPVAILADPLFFYVPLVRLDLVCVELDRSLSLTVTLLKMLIDFVYFIHIVLQLGIAFAPSPTSEASRYMRGQFWLDLVVILPVPQLVISVPALWTSSRLSSKKVLSTWKTLILIFHYILRLFRMLFIVKQSKMAMSRKAPVETVWTLVAYNIILYMLASHVTGASWYLLTVVRQDACWRQFCANESTCLSGYFSCSSLQDDKIMHHRANWLNSTNISSQCVAASVNPTGTAFSFGLFSLAVERKITSLESFAEKYFFCLWFSLRSLSSLCQGYQVSAEIWEIFFAFIMFIIGFFAFIHTKQRISAQAIREREMRMKKKDAEEWMHFHKLPKELRNRTRKYHEFSWVETQGVNEVALLQSLPQDLRTDITRHLCFKHLTKIPLFNRMGDQRLEEVCQKLQPIQHMENSYLLHEGEPVAAVVFIDEGEVEASASDSNRVELLGPGDFWGHELLFWAFNNRSHEEKSSLFELTPEELLPLAEWTMQTRTKVEGFSLSSTDLISIARNYKNVSNKKNPKRLKTEDRRYYFNEWVWAALVIQVAWRKKQTLEKQKWAASLIHKFWRRRKQMLAERQKRKQMFEEMQNRRKLEKQKYQETLEQSKEN
ncbi:hypothetical protein R1flu_013456 [Riccia fluitans]|uniref:Cyclic nucleotide-binding domain-containing protein n=1 Tax=Riccia fluitans TaxID=41844 RepID=A0ABD1YDN2_9MARC